MLLLFGLICYLYFHTQTAYLIMRELTQLGEVIYNYTGYFIYDMLFYDLEINNIEFSISKSRGQLSNSLVCTLVLFIFIEVFYLNLILKNGY